MHARSSLRVLRHLAIASALLTLAASCGGSDDDAEGGGAGAPQAGAAGAGTGGQAGTGGSDAGSAGTAGKASAGSGGKAGTGGTAGQSGAAGMSSGGSAGTAAAAGTAGAAAIAGSSGAGGSEPDAGEDGASGQGGSQAGAGGSGAASGQGGAPADAGEDADASSGGAAGAAGGAAGSGGAGGCTQGEQRCTGPNLTDKEGCVLGSWVFQDTCVTPELCAQAVTKNTWGCPSPMCAPGDLHCELPAELGLCNAGRTGFDVVDNCVNLALCYQSMLHDSTTCTPPACSVGEHQCFDDMFASCKADQTGFTYEQCYSAVLCQQGVSENLGTCAPPVCQVGVNAPKCSDDHTARMDCNADGTAFLTWPCNNGALCYETPYVHCGYCQPGAKGGCLLTGGVPTTFVCNSLGEWVATPCGALEECDIGGRFCVSRTVTLTVPASTSTYAMDITEATYAQYNAWLATNPPLTLLPWECGWKTGYTTNTKTGAQPAEQLDWCDAYAYCAGIGRRLCGKIGGGGVTGNGMMADSAQDQWFNACSGGGVNLYPYGNTYQAQTCNGDDADFNNCHADVSCSSLPVGSLAGCVTATGVYDLSGNASEWEDNCPGSANPHDDSCVIRGASWRIPDTAGGQPGRLSCMPQLNTMRYNANAAARCCSN